ncbi:hypothetical protein [Candidatus Collinsella stercoripullorum]|uniref:hypothetical protein n=1 Tax=Candidatus Collinsella stercoripullorum TaxID=2838522 RepID=UPI003A4D53F9
MAARVTASASSEACAPIACGSASTASSSPRADASARASAASASSREPRRTVRRSDGASPRDVSISRRT